MMSWDGDWEQQVPLSRRGLAGVVLAEGISEDLKNGLCGETALCQGLPAATWGVPPASGVQKMIPPLPGDQSQALWGTDATGLEVKST